MLTKKLYTKIGNKFKKLSAIYLPQERIIFQIVLYVKNVCFHTPLIEVCANAKNDRF